MASAMRALGGARGYEYRTDTFANTAPTARPDGEPVLVCFSVMVIRVNKQQRLGSGSCAMTGIVFSRSAHGHFRA